MGLEQLSDDELIQTFLQAHPLHRGNDASAMLWQRYAAFAEYLLQRQTNRLPHGHDRHTFVQEARQRMRINLMRRLSGYQGPNRFKPYLAQVVRSAALDQSRAVTGRLAHERPVGDTRQSEAATADDGRDDLPFRSRYAFLAPFDFVISRERESIIGRALALHAQQSHQHVKSAVAIRRRFWEELKVVDIAGEFSVDERTIYRLLHEDYQELRRLLKDHFGIEDSSQL